MEPDQHKASLYRAKLQYSYGNTISFRVYIVSTALSIILFHLLLTGTVVDSGYKLSKDCTRISLAGRKITAIEGQPFNFGLKAYNTDCDNVGCKSYYGQVLVCSTNSVCKSCNIYTGPFASSRIQVGIWLLSDIYTSAPGATCTITGILTAPPDRSYPVSCVIKNNHASDVYQYLLRVVVLDESNPSDLGNPADLQSMIGLGATIKVVAGVIDPLSSSIYWANKLQDYYAGDNLELTVALKDQFGNVVSEKTGLSDLDYPWNVTVVDTRTNILSFPSFDVIIDRDGYHNISFLANQVGPQSVSISNNGRIVGGYSLPFNVKTGMLYLPLCRGNWVDNKHTYIAGTIAQFRLKVVDKTNAPLGSTNLLYSVFKVFDEAGKRDLQTILQMHNEDEPGYVLTEFKTAKAGRYYVFIGNNTFYVPGSPFPYDVVVGPVYIPACKGVLMQEDAFQAGSTVVLNITLYDCCGNIVTRLSYVEFSVSVSFYGSKLSSPPIVKGLEQSTGYQTISFYPTLSGKYSLSVGFKRDSILNSPFAFTVLPGPFSVGLSKVIEHTDFSNAIAGFPINLKVQQRDVYGNAFTTEIMYTFQVIAYEVTNGKQNLVVPSVSATYDAKSGVQTLNVVLHRSGNYYLEVGGLSGNISGSPFSIAVKAGALNITACIGSWVSNNITAGSLVQFKVLQMDSFGNKVNLGVGSSILWSANISWAQSFNRSSGEYNSLRGISIKIFSSLNMGVVGINFNITAAGEYILNVAGFSAGRLIRLSGSPFYFRVDPDSVLPETSSYTWLQRSTYTAGDKALGTVQFRDRFNNSLFFSQKGTKLLQVKIFQVLQLEALNFTDTKITQSLKGGMVTISFPTTVSGNFRLMITDMYGSSVKGSPFPFTVAPGLVVVKNCIGQWYNATPQVEEGSLAKFFVMERDSFGNVVCKNISKGEKQLEFQAKVLGLEEAHVLDMEFQPVQGEENGTVCAQLLKFVVFYDLGHFRLEIKSSNQSIMGSPYSFTIVEGPVSSSLSTFEGPGLEISYAGKRTYFVMRLRDNSGAPKGSHLNSLSVQIFIFGGTVQIKPLIVAVPNNLGVFNVSYLPMVSGIYVILTRWIGIQLGETRYMTVNPGPISIKNCSGKWDSDYVNVPAGTIAKFIITQRDVYGNEFFSNSTADAALFTAKIFKLSNLGSWKPFPPNTKQWNRH
ncbi:hypothetical protein GOP47_0010619 [Adiantum capillus-veneris]|uniref:GEX2 N-terminal Ig-like domain-containing protein n=1 Tax=Adiantum capillus-veneris TaxID=13818 RepID=A0A9D4UW67_ADICA|nr:hypothetical protein GOP47_0010619 [Adiantum capillus-veneris]